MSNVDFCSADFREANFSGAAINGLKLDGNIRYEGSKWRGASITNLSYDPSFTSIFTPFVVHVRKEGGEIN